jgi:menaquinone-dependent protoporphyrinogen oxidase
MMSIFRTHGTTEGQTAKIAAFIADVVRGHDATMTDVKDTAETIPGGYDTVIVGASIHMVEHDEHVVDFVAKNQGSPLSVESSGW